MFGHVLHRGKLVLVLAVECCIARLWNGNPLAVWTHNFSMFHDLRFEVVLSKDSLGLVSFHFLHELFGLINLGPKGHLL